MSARGSSYIKRPFDFLLVVIEDKRVNYGAFSLLLKRRQRKCTPKPTDTEVVYVPLKRVPTTTGHVSCLSIKKDLGWHIWGHTEHNFFGSTHSFLTSPIWHFLLVKYRYRRYFFRFSMVFSHQSSDKKQVGVGTILLRTREVVVQTVLHYYLQYLSFFS